MNIKLENGQFLRITELYAFIAKDDKGHEGLMGMQMADGAWMPLIGADIERVDSIKIVADKIKEITGRDYEIRYFVQRI